MVQQKSKKPSTLWISNISKKDVSVSDLDLTIKARSSINLLNKRNLNYSLTQIVQSLRTGSLYKNRDKLIVRKVEPEIEEQKIIAIDYNAVAPSRRRSAVKVEEVQYEELNISDEDFAQQASDLVDENLPITKV